MRLVIEIEREKFLGSLHEDKAPKTCSAILKALPINGKVIHARWSGEAIWLPMDDFAVTVDFENLTIHPSKGELLFYPGFLSEKEILIPYGSSTFASKVGFLPGNHFASIEDGLEKLAEVGKRVLWEGAKKITIAKE